MYKRGFAPILILLIIVAIGAVGYFGYKTSLISPNPTIPSNPTDNWKTYTNENLKYSIKLPRDWKIIEHSSSFNETFEAYESINGQKIEVTKITSPATKCKVNCPVLESGVTTNIGNYPAERRDGYFDKKDGNIPHQFIMYNISDKEYPFNENKPGGDNYDSFPNYTFSLNIMFHASTSGYKPGDETVQISKTDKYLFDQILSTFKFSDSTNSSQLPKRTFVTTDKFFDTYNYPSELLNLKDTDLVGFKCNDKTELSVEGSLDQYGLVWLKSNDAVTFLHGIKSLASATTCTTEENKTMLFYVAYSNTPPGGGAGSNSYFGYLLGSTMPIKAIVQMENGAYFSCSQVLAITKNGTLYAKCGAGDGGFGSVSLYKMSLKSSDTAKLLYKCTSTAQNEGEVPTVKCGTTQ